MLTRQVERPPETRRHPSLGGTTHRSGLHAPATTCRESAVATTNQALLAASHHPAELSYWAHGDPRRAIWRIARDDRYCREMSRPDPRVLVAHRERSATSE